MAHPHAAHRAHHVAHAHKMIHRAGYKRGGAVHQDEAQDEGMIREAVHQHDEQLHKKGHSHDGRTKLHFADGEKGRSHLAKRARGGATQGKKHGNTKVNVIVAPQGGGGMHPPMPSPIAAPPRPAAPPPMAPPAGMGGGAPPPMPPGAMTRPGMGMPGAGMGMMRARGGKIPHEEAGAMSGIGRIDKVHEYGSGRGFKPKKIPMAARGR